MGQVSESDFYNGLRPWLQTAAAVPVGLVDPPETSVKKYAIIYPITDGRESGSWADPVEDMDIVFQVTSVGRTQLEALWVKDLVRRAILNRGTNGEYLHPLAIAGLSIQWRSPEGSGATIPGGDDLYQVPATYRFRTGA